MNKVRIVNTVGYCNCDKLFLFCDCLCVVVNRVWRYKGVIKIRKSKKDRQHNGQKKKRQEDKQRFPIHYTENLRSSNTNSTKIRCEIICSRRVGTSCSTSGTRRVTLVTNPIISGTYPWSFVTHIFRNGQPSHGRDGKTLEVMTWT